MRALLLIRDAPHYRSDAFRSGLTACGFRVVRDLADPKPGDVLVCWNRYGTAELLAERFERAGARVLVAENGYLGTDGWGRQFYAIAEGQHNGAGRWHVGSADRLALMGPLGLTPWRATGGHILVTGQRGIGSREMASPHCWAEDVARRLKQITRREIRIRPHPETRGVTVPPIPLEQDLRGCWAVVTWASGAAVKAIVAGVPVFHEAPHWILSGAGTRDIREIEAPWMGCRHPHLQRLAWAQWKVDEIASGLPFRLLLGLERAAA